ncbi:hypothetical protein [Fodinicola acaciae]|uniref:hypothetical protein n=1 Tax=Fodinicola acaciae TaxID=2681555 RepID=UPI0013D83489|nr:hypothetical protein [Fodinicola acaciae]
MPGSEGARLVRAGAYQPRGRRQRKRVYLWLSFLPFMLPLYLFTPDYRLGKPDHVIERMHRIRTWVAIVGALATTLPYITHPDFWVYLDAFAGDAPNTAIALVPIYLISAAIVVLLTPLRWRGDAIRLMLRPTLTTLIPLAVSFGVVAWIAAQLPTFHVDRDRLVVSQLLFAFFLLWFIIYFIQTIYLVLRHLLNAIDANLLLPPVITTLFGWWIPVQRLIWQSSVRPVWLDVLSGVVAALVLTGLSLWEIRRMYARGIMPAAGPYPPLPPPPPVPVPQPYPPQPYPPYPPQPYPPR